MSLNFHEFPDMFSLTNQRLRAMLMDRCDLQSFGLIQTLSCPFLYKQIQYIYITVYIYIYRKDIYIYISYIIAYSILQHLCRLFTTSHIG